MLRAYQALRAGDVPDRLRPWLFRIARNAALDSVRRSRELGVPLEQLPDVEAAAADDAQVLPDALRALPEQLRQVYVLREIRGLRNREIAHELSIGPGQVEQALFAARNLLAETLVFGQPLECETVRALMEGPLDRAERRALRAHLRGCRACAREQRRRGLVLVPLLPVDVLDFVRRRLGTHAAVKGAAIAAATGAAVATPLVLAQGSGARPTRAGAVPAAKHERAAPPSRSALSGRFGSPLAGLAAASQAAAPASGSGGAHDPVEPVEPVEPSGD